MREEIYLISDAARQVQVESHVLRYWEEELKLPIRRNELGHRYYTRDDIEQLKQIKILKEKGLQLKAIKLVISGSDMEILRRDPDMVRETAREEAGREKAEQEEKERSLSEQEEKERSLSEQEERERNRAEQEEKERSLLKQEERERNRAEQKEKERSLSEQEEKERSLPEQEEKERSLAAEPSERDGMPVQTDRAEKDRHGRETGGGEGMQTETMMQETQGAAAPADVKTEKGLRLQLLLQRMISDAVRENNEEMYGMFREILLKELDYQFRMQEETEEAREQKRMEREEEHFRKLDELLGEKRKGKKEKRKKHPWF